MREIDHLSRGKPEAGAKVSRLLERLKALKGDLASASHFSGEDWSADYAEVEAIESEFDDVYWRLKTDDLLSD